MRSLEASDQDRVWQQTGQSRMAYQSPFLGITETAFKRPDGVTGTYYSLEVPGHGAMVAACHQGRVLLVREYRLPLGAIVWGLPGGRSDPGDDPEATLRRELSEETGLVVNGPLLPLTRLVPSAAVTNHTIHCYAVRVADISSLERQDSEIASLHWLSLPEIESLLRSVDVLDAPSQAALLHLLLFHRAWVNES